MSNIYVPSRGRWDRRGLAEVLGDRAVYVVYEHEVKHYKESYPEARVVAQPAGITHIGGARDWIVTELADEEFVWMCDDDVRMGRGLNLLDSIDQCTDYARENGLDLVSMGYQFMVNQRRESDGEWSDKGYMTRCWAVRRSSYTEEFGRPMREWPMDEDTALLLTVLLAGGRYARSNVYTVGERRNTGGGCEEYRTDETVIASMRRLERTFPEVVQIVSSNGVQHGRRLGLKPRVSWRKLRR